MPSHVKTYYSRGKLYHYFRPPEGSGMKPVPLSSDVRRAAVQAARMAAMAGRPRPPVTKARSDILRATLRDHMRSVLHAARSRAKAGSVPCTISLEDLLGLLEEQNYCCAMSGRPFEYLPPVGRPAHKNPFRPSLDRRHRSLGYVMGNCRLVCTAINFALGEWGDEVFLQLALGSISSRLEGVGKEAQDWSVLLEED